MEHRIYTLLLLLLSPPSPQNRLRRDCLFQKKKGMIQRCCIQWKPTTANRQVIRDTVICSLLLVVESNNILTQRPRHRARREMHSSSIWGCRISDDSIKPCLWSDTIWKARLLPGEPAWCSLLLLLCKRLQLVLTSAWEYFSLGGKGNITDLKRLSPRLGWNCAMMDLPPTDPLE